MRYVSCKKESTQMEHIYSESILNIAATCTNSNSNRLFRTRRPISQRMPSEWKSIRIPCRVSPERISGDIYIGPRSGRSIHGNTLETRGWVLQETLLAPRTTYYGKEQLFLALPASLNKGRKTSKLQHCCSSRRFKGFLPSRNFGSLGSRWYSRI
jgi:hypothetical protein